MPRPTRATAFVLTAWLLGTGQRPTAAADDFAFYHENVMGTSLELHVKADDPAAARRAEARVLGEIDRLSAVFSGYDPSSEFSRWQSAQVGPVKVSPELFEVLRASDHWREATGGAFDPRVEALSRLWAAAARRDRLPTVDEQAAAKALMSRPAWRLDPGALTAERLSDGPLSLNAIAKGYIVERACTAALDPGRGVHALLLNVGGDLRACGDTPRTVGIARPRGDSETSEPVAYVEVRDRAVATSGDSQRGFRVEGRWHSHIFDPRAAAPAPGGVHATVIAERSADADALATAFNVLSPDESVRIANALPGVDCLIVAADGRAWRSDGWHRYEKPRPTPLALARGQAPADPTSKKGKGDEAGKGQGKEPPPSSWGDEFELVVNFEINRPEAEAGRYRRPYVAVWVEDKDGFPVRNLVLWVSQTGSGPFQWLPDLRRWYRADQARKKVDKTEMVFTVARPTRPPGKYSVIWDGKDDQDKPVAPGEYTVSIDAAREHGTYQNIRKQVTIAGTPFAEELKGNVEIRAASIEYRRKNPAK
jgi:thiamine biosynthesis lipoprotein ApbE